ncbi:MAG: sulfurtransferase TusA family protein [Candidatus Dormibacteria bacterium]
MTPATVLDLRGTPCPLNYVKARLELDRLDRGAALEVWLDVGEPEDQVPRSLRLDGHLVEAQAAPAGQARFRVLKGAQGT